MNDNTPRDPSSPIPERWGVLLVHGVGESKPGQTLDWFVPTFQKLRGVSQTAIEEQRTLKDDDGREFPMSVRTVALNPTQETDPNAAGTPREAVFSEVYWADVSRCGDSPWDLIVRIFTIIFRLYYLTQQAARAPGMLSWLLRVCLYGVSGILCGPIAALNGFMLLLLISQGIYGALGYPDIEYTTVAAVGLAGLVIALLFLIPARRSPGSYPWSLALSCSVLIGLGIAIVGFLEHQRDELLLREIVTAGDGKRIITDHFKRIFMVHFSYLLLLTHVCFLAVGLLAFLAVLFWLGAVLTSLGSRYWRRTIPGLTVGLAATLLQLGAWVIVVPALGLTGLTLFLPSLLEQYPFDRIWSFFLFNLSAGLCVLLIGILVWLWRWAHIQKHADPPRSGPTPHVPRILFHWLILAALIGSTLLGAGSFATVFLLGRDPLYHDFFRSQMAWARPALLTAAGLVLLGFLYGPFRNALHITMDIISHFHRASVRFPMPLPGRKESKPLPREDAVRDYFVQQRIERRLHIVLDELLRMDNLTHLTIVAHSQGSMIAVDTLWLDKVARSLHRGDGGPRVFLVTMGSPVTHLYQHYFPWRYGPFFPREQPASDFLVPWGEGLKRSLDGWMNIFRVNDFVGRQIEGAENFPENICFPKAGRGGGHTAYWDDPAVLEEMGRYLPG